MNPESHQIIELWKLVQQDDQRAFDLIYQEYVQIIFSTVYNHIGHRQDSMDIVQETFLDLWEKRSAIHIKTSFFNYLYSVARYKTLRYIKDKAGRKQYVQSGVPDRESQNLPAETPEILTKNTLLRVEAVIQQEINSLPAQMKKVYELHTTKNMTVQEIAARLLLSPSTVKNHLVKTRRRLRQVISRLVYLLFSLLFILVTMLPKY